MTRQAAIGSLSSIRTNHDGTHRSISSTIQRPKPSPPDAPPAADRVESGRRFHLRAVIDSRNPPEQQHERSR
ncbi:hypothetical protein ACLOJK_004898 [Asimina triloba]